MNWFLLIGLYWLVSIPVAVLLGRLLSEFPGEPPEYPERSRPPGRA